MNRINRFLGMAAGVLVLGTASLAQGQAWYWNVTGPADWTNVTNWNISDSFGGDPSLFGNNASVITGGTATIGSGQSAVDSSSGGIVLIGGSSANVGGSGGNGYVTMSGGTLSNSTLPLGEVLGVDAGGSGIFTQSGGINVPFKDIPTLGTGSINFSYLR